MNKRFLLVPVAVVMLSATALPALAYDDDDDECTCQAPSAQQRVAPPMITGPAAGTVGTINSMMHQAFTGNAADLQRQYHGMNSMNAGIAASTKKLTMLTATS